jgi:hypothetical protein
LTSRLHTPFSDAATRSAIGKTERSAPHFRKDSMKLRPASILALAVVALAPIAVAAQTPVVPTAAPLLYAENAAPTSSSSSVDSNAVAESTASAPAATVAPAAKSGSSLPFSGLAIGVKFGLAGIGFDVATPLVSQWINLRSGASFITFSPSTIMENNLNINGTIKFQNAATMVDFFPFHGRFRISGGATIYNNTGFTATLAAPLGQPFTLGGITYYSDPRNPIAGSGVFTFGGNKVVPRATIGFGNMLPKKGHFRFETELGFQYISAPTVLYTFTGNGCPAANSPESNCTPISQTSITQEQINLQNDLKDLRFFPILSFGISYKIH